MSLTTKHRLLIAIPTVPEGPIHVGLAQFLVRAKGEGHGWDTAVSYVQSKPVASTRNDIVRAFLETDRDYLLMIDSDAVPDEESYAYLLDDILRPEVDVVGGWSVFMMPDGPVPAVQRYSATGGCHVHEDILSREPGLHEIADGGLGAHCLLAKRSTYEHLYANRRVWFKDVLRDQSLERHELQALLDNYRDDKSAVYGEIETYLRDSPDMNPEHVGKRKTGQDVWFFRQCHALRLRCFVDTRAFWGHVKLSDIRGEFMQTQVLHRRIAELEMSA